MGLMLLSLISPLNLVVSNVTMYTYIEKTLSPLAALHDKFILESHPVITSFSDNSYAIVSNYKIVWLRTAYKASGSISSVIPTQAGIIVTSNEYDPQAEKYFCKVVFIDAKSFAKKWEHKFDYALHQVLLYDLDCDGIDEVIVNYVSEIYVYNIVSGDLLWKGDLPSSSLVVPLWDIDNDSLVELFVTSGGVSYESGHYYWEVWLGDINTPENKIAYQRMRIPCVACPHALAVGNWSLTNYYKLAVFYAGGDYAPSITFVDPQTLEVETVLNFTSSRIYTGSIVYNDKYILFLDEVYEDGIQTYRVVNIFNESVEWTYQVKDEYLYIPRRGDLYLSNFDDDPGPEVLVAASGDLAILDIKTGVATSYLTGEYYRAIPLDVNWDGISEILAFEPYKKAAMLSNVLQIISNITYYPEDMEWNPSDIWPVAIDIDQDTCYELIFLNSTSDALEIYSLREAVPPRLEVLSPRDNAVVRDSVIINCSAYDNESGIQRVEMFLDGVPLVKITTPENDHYYTYYWDTTSVWEGSHTLRIIAYDNEGNMAFADIRIIVDNTYQYTVSWTGEITYGVIGGIIAVAITIVFIKRKRLIRKDS